MIQYVQFLAEVSVGGDHNAIPYWSREKHGKTIDIEERGSYLVLVLKAPQADDKGNSAMAPTGSIRRVPITNVAYISEIRDVQDKPKAGK